MPVQIGFAPLADSGSALSNPYSRGEYSSSGDDTSTSTVAVVLWKVVSAFWLVLSGLGSLVGVTVLCIVVVFVLVGIPLLMLAACDINVGINWKQVFAAVRKQGTNSWRRLRYIFYQRRRRPSQVTHVSFKGGSPIRTTGEVETVEDVGAGGGHFSNELQPQVGGGIGGESSSGMRGRPHATPAQRL
jgi:hypothetical protein